MNHFEDFEHLYGPPENCEKPSDEAIRAYEGLLPPELLDHWRDVGWCAYGKGLLWVVNPQQFEDVVEDWVDFESGRSFAFLRTAFAHLYLWHEGYVYSLDVQYGSLSKVTKNIKRIFTLLCDPEIQENILRTKLYEQALERLGPPDRDECYAFVPALALGGSGGADTVQRVKIREHLGLLAQILFGE
jgi:hypothetical protein